MPQAVFESPCIRHLVAKHVGAEDDGSTAACGRLAAADVT
jgi:hypothetical protein